MKKKIKKSFVLVLTFIMAFSVAQIAKVSVNGVQNADSAENSLSLQMESEIPTESEKEYSTYGLFTYEILNDEVTIISCDEDEAEGEVVIPWEIEGYPVTALGDHSFYYCIKISKLSIPPTVTTIGAYAFGCEIDYDSELLFESIFIPESVTSIGYNAFYECGNLKEIIVDEDNPVFSNDEYGVLFNKDKTELIKYPSGKDKTDYSVPEGVETISDCAFSGAALDELFIPASVAEIATDALFTYSIKSIAVESENDYFSNDEYGVLFNKDKTKLICYPSAAKKTSYTVPESVKEIEICAFSDAENLESIELSAGIKKIDYCTFSGCTNLKNITLPDKLRVIGEYAFDGCRSLEKFIVPYGVVRVDYFAFRGCTNLEYVHLTEDVTAIGRDILDETEGAYICSDTDACFAKEYADEYGYEFRLCDGHGLVKPETTTYPDITRPSTSPSTEPYEPSTNPSVPDHSVTTPNEESTTKPYEESTIGSSENYEGELTVSIRIPTTTTIKYGDSIILYVDTACRLPSGVKIIWTPSNNNFEIAEVSKDGRCCRITPKSSGTTAFVVSLVDANGNVIDTDTQEMTSKSCCFYKIIAFFKKLFGITKTIPQIYKGLF